MAARQARPDRRDAGAPEIMPTFTGMQRSTGAIVVAVLVRGARRATGDPMAATTPAAVATRQGVTVIPVNVATMGTAVAAEDVIAVAAMATAVAAEEGGAVAATDPPVATGRGPTVPPVAVVTGSAAAAEEGGAVAAATDPPVATARGPTDPPVDGRTKTAAGRAVEARGRRPLPKVATLKVGRYRRRGGPLLGKPFLPGADLHRRPIGGTS